MVNQIHLFIVILVGLIHQSWSAESEGLVNAKSLSVQAKNGSAVAQTSKISTEAPMIKEESELTGPAFIEQDENDSDSVYGSFIEVLPKQKTCSSCYVPELSDSDKARIVVRRYADINRNWTTLEDALSRNKISRSTVEKSEKSASFIKMGTPEDRNMESGFNATKNYKLDHSLDMDSLYMRLEDNANKNKAKLTSNLLCTKNMKKPGQVNSSAPDEAKEKQNVTSGAASGRAVSLKDEYSMEEEGGCGSCSKRLQESNWENANLKADELTQNQDLWTWSDANFSKVEGNRKINSLNNVSTRCTSIPESLGVELQHLSKVLSKIFYSISPIFEERIPQTVNQISPDRELSFTLPVSSLSRDETNSTDGAANDVELELKQLKGKTEKGRVPKIKSESKSVMYEFDVQTDATTFNTVSSNSVTSPMAVQNNDLNPLEQLQSINTSPSTDRLANFVTPPAAESTQERKVAVTEINNINMTRKYTVVPPTADNHPGEMAYGPKDNSVINKVQQGSTLTESFNSYPELVHQTLIKHPDTKEKLEDAFESARSSVLYGPATKSNLVPGKGSFVFLTGTNDIDYKIPIDHPETTNVDNHKNGFNLEDLAFGKGIDTASGPKKRVKKDVLQKLNRWVRQALNSAEIKTNELGKVGKLAQHYLVNGKNS